ncbi:hypothetical protein Pmani_005150 [Petrolisthes manimaculis]|uniref:Reverse transcriptase n=1 Tax=Petrolisthes manimaculis TaxID=1843537 RepID=A0AAE1QFF2_9EUCA|nr:hypothetical protein Pmani_005150 [Petrolisthes manimaculis]
MYTIPTAPPTMDHTSLSTAIPNTISPATPMQPTPVDITSSPTATSDPTYTHNHTTALVKLRLLHTFSGKQRRRWQDNALHVTAYSTTPNSWPISNTPTLRHRHPHAPPPSNHNTSANLTTSPLLSALQHITKSAHTPHPTARTLLWVEDLELGDNFFVDTSSEVIVVPSMTKERECQGSMVCDPHSANKLPIVTLGTRNSAVTLLCQEDQTPEQHLRELCDRLQQYGLKIHPSKCILGVESLDFLGDMGGPLMTSPCYPRK